MSEARELLTARIAGWKNYKEKNTAFSPDAEFYDDAEADDDEDILNYIERLEAENARMRDELNTCAVRANNGLNQGGEVQTRALELIREDSRQVLKESEDGSDP